MAQSPQLQTSRHIYQPLATPNVLHCATYELLVLVHSDNTSTSASNVFCGLLFSARVLAGAVFVVYWGVDSEPGKHNTLDRRFLRLTLERSAGAADANDFRDLWVGVEISDAYWNWNNGIDGDNQPVPRR